MSRVTSDLTCNETMPTSDEKLDARPGYRAAGYGGPSTSAGQQRYPPSKQQASRALYPGSLIPSMSGLPHGLSLAGTTAAAVVANNKATTANPLLAANAANAATVAQREAELRREQAKKKEEEEQLKTYEEALRASRSLAASLGPSTSSAHPGIIRPTPTMATTYGASLLHHTQTIHSIAGGSSPRPVPATSQSLLAAHDYLASTPQIREPQVKQIPKGGGLVHAPYNPAMKNRLDHHREATTSHTIARPIPRHAEPQTNPAQFALNQAAQAQQEAIQRSKALHEKREAEARQQLQQIERERQLLLERQRAEEERQMRADMSGMAPIVRPAQRGTTNHQPILDASRSISRGMSTPVPQRLGHNISMANAMANAAVAAAAQLSKQKEEQERFERERDRLERAAAEPMIYPQPVQHQSPMHIPNILQGRNNWPKLNPGNNSSPQRDYSPIGGMNSTGLGTSGVYDQLLQNNLLNSPYARGLFNQQFGGVLGPHISPSPSTPHMATPSPRPSILRRKGNDNSAAKRRLGFDESNPQTVGELASAQLASGVIGLSDAKKIKLEMDIKKEQLDVPSTSSHYFSSISAPLTVTEIKREFGPPTSAEPTPQKKRQRKQQFDANQAPEQIRMQITDPPYVPVMGMTSADYPGEVRFYQLPPEAPKKKRGRPSAHAKEQAQLQVQSTTRSVIVDVDQPKVVQEKKKGGRKKQAQPVLPSKTTTIVKEEIEITFTPPPRPSSSARPKSAILQQHHAQLQLALQQQDEQQRLQQQQRQQSQTPQQLQSPRAGEQSPFNYDADDYSCGSDDDLISPEALAAAKKVAEELGFIGPDGEPRETTPMRLAREQEEAEEEEERQRELLERLNSAGLLSLQAAIRKKEELERQEQEEEEREERELEEKEKKALRRADKKLRFLSHDNSIIRRFLRKVKGLDRGAEISDDSESEGGTETAAADKEQGVDASSSGESDDSEASEDSVESDSGASERDSDSELVTVTEDQLARLKERGEEFDVVRELDEEGESTDSDDDNDEEDDDHDDAQDLLDSQKNYAARMVVEMQLERLLEDQKKAEIRKERDEKLETEIQKALMRLEELNKEELADGDEDVQEPIDKQKERRRTLIPLDALGDRDDVLRAPRKLIIAPSAATPRGKNNEDLEKIGKKREVKKALGYMQLWKRAHSSNEDTRGIVIDEPVDLERDLLKARRRDTMIERTFNRLKKKNERDRLREKMREELLEKRNVERKRQDDEDKDDDAKTIETLIDEMEESIEKEEKKEEGTGEKMEEDPKDDSEKKDEGEDQSEKIVDPETLEDEKQDENDQEDVEDEEDDDEVELDPKERARIQKENDELLRNAIAEVDEKMQKRDLNEGMAKNLQSYFSEPSSSYHDNGVVRTVKSLQKNINDEDSMKDDLEELLQELVEIGDGEAGENEKKENEENESDDEECEEYDQVEVSTDILKISTTKKSRLGVPSDEWDTMLSSVRQADVVELFGVPFAKGDDELLIPVVSAEEQEQAKKVRFAHLGQKIAQKVEKALSLEERYQGADALPRAMTRFRRNEAVDKAMMRDLKESEELDPDLVDVEDQVVGFLSTSIDATKREALLVKQMADMEKEEKLDRTDSPNPFFKRKPNRKSIHGDYSIDYNAREKWATGDEGDSLKTNKDQQKEFIRRQFERIEEERRAKLDRLVESAIALREERQHLPCPSKDRQDAAKERILEKYSVKTRDLMLQAYHQFFDDEGQEMAGTSSGARQTVRRDESALERIARIAQFVNKHGLAEERGEISESAWFEKLKELRFSGEENDEEGEDNAEKDVRIVEDHEVDSESGVKTRIEPTETFDLEDIRKICHEAEEVAEMKEEEKEEQEEVEKDDEETDEEEEQRVKRRRRRYDSGEIYAMTSDCSEISALEEEDVDDCEEIEVVAEKKATGVEMQSEDVKEEVVEDHARAVAATSSESPENAEVKEEEKEAEEYEDHVVTMTRGGKTVTHVVRRPSNATAAINASKRGEAPKKKTSTEQRPYFTRVNAQGKTVRVYKKKKQMTEDEQYQEFAKTATTRFVTLEESDPLIHNEVKILSEMRTMEHEYVKYGNIEKRREKYEVTEKEKAQIAEEIEAELYNEELGTVSATNLKEKINANHVLADHVFGVGERSGDKVEAEEGNEEDSNYDEENYLSNLIRSDSSSGEDDDPEVDISSLRPFKNSKIVDTTEDVNSFPWVEDIQDYDPHVLSKHGKKLSTMRKNLLQQVGQFKANIKPKKFYRFRMTRPERKQKFVSPFHSLYGAELPDALENDLNVFKLIITTCSNDDTLSSSDLVLLRKKINLSKKGFAEVIKRKSVDPPKAFKDLVRFAIERGHGYEKRAADLKAISKWQHMIESGKMGRVNRKSILKEVKVTRQKFNARFGRKFHRSDWSLKRELLARWKRESLMADEKMAPRMGNKQLLQEMRKMHEISEAHKLGCDRADIETRMDDQKRKREKREKAKEKKETKKGRKNSMRRMSTSLDDDKMEKGELRGSIVMFDRRAEEIDYSDDDEDCEGSDYTDPSRSATDSEEERQRRERSWTYETVKNSSDDESFVDFGHTHWIGPQVFLDGRELSPPLPEDSTPNHAPKLVINASAFPEERVVAEADGEAPSTSFSAASTVTVKSPTKAEEQPRPFLTLAQRKAYFTEESEEAKKLREDEEEKKKEEEEKQAQIRKEEEERKEEEKRLLEEKRAEEERLEKEEEEKNERLFGGLLKQIDEDTWQQQLKMIVDRTMTSFRRSQAIEYLLSSALEMDCTKQEVLAEIEQWESEAERKRIACGSLDYLPLKSLFDADSSNALRKGVKVQKRKDLLSSLPDAVLIEDLVDSMCTFITAHLDDVTILAELRIGAEKEKVKIRTLPSRPERNELLVKRSIAAVGEEEAGMVERTLEDTRYNHLSVVGATSTGVVLAVDRTNNLLFDEVRDELARRDEEDCADAIQNVLDQAKAMAASRTPTPMPIDDCEWETVREELRKRLGIACKEDVEALESALMDDAIVRESSPDLVGLINYARDDRYDQVKPGPISSKMRKNDAPEQKGIRPVTGSSGLISNSILMEISDQLKAAEKDKMKIKEEEDEDMLEMPEVENKKLYDEFLRMRDVVNAVRDEMTKKIGEVKDEEKLDQYLREHIWSDSKRSSNVQMMIDDVKKQRERERRKLIDIGDITARVFDLSAKGQLERWMEDVCYMSPFAEDGKRILSKLSAHRDPSLHYQLVLRSEEDDDGVSVQRIHPEMVMKWIEEEEEGAQHRRSEVVHKFPMISAHQWESIQRLIRLAEEEINEANIVSDEDDEERPVLLPIEGEENVVVLEKEDLALDQEGIVNNDKFVDLELRHSARVLKHKMIGFSTSKAVNAWKKNFSRAFKTGRVMKHVVDEHEPELASTTPDIRQSIRYRCMQNSIKQVKGITKERVELLGEGLHERHLKRARKAVRKQRRLIRMHYRKIACAEMRSYKAEVQMLDELRRQRKEERAQHWGGIQKDCDEPMEVNHALPIIQIEPAEKQRPIEDDDIKPADDQLQENSVEKKKEEKESNDDSMKSFGIVYTENEAEAADIVIESSDEGDEEVKEEHQNQIKELTLPPHPLRRAVKTLAELSRPLTDREAKLLHLLKEKRASGQTLLSVHDLKKNHDSAPVVEMLNDGSESVVRIDLESDSDGEDEDGEADLECVLFHSYPPRIRRALIRSMEKREERILEAKERYEMYRRQKERAKRREREEKEKEDQEGIEKNDVVYKGGMVVDADKIPHGFCPRWIHKIANGRRVTIRNVAYMRMKERLQLRNQRVIMGRASRRRKVPLTRLHYVIDGPKSQELIRAEEEAEREKELANNILVDVDTSRIPITKAVIDHFVECQVKSDDAKLEMKENLIAEHDRTLKKKGVRFLDDDVDVALKQEAEIEKMIDEAKSHQNAVEKFRDVIENMRSEAIQRITIDPFEQVDLEIEEAVENERRVLEDYLKMLQTMDSARFAELAKLWSYDIDSDDDAESLDEKRWARVRQFVLQKPVGSLKNWESKTAYVDDWEEKMNVPRKREIVAVMGPVGPYFRGIEEKKRQGYFVNEAGLPVKPKKPKYFKPLESDPEHLENSDLEEMCHPDLNARHEDNLATRRRLADLCNRDFSIRQEELAQRGVKRKAALMRKFKKTEKNMPELGDGLRKVYEQNSVFDALPVKESYWSHRRRVDPNMDALLKKTLENTREMFAAVVQPMYRIILVLRETRRRMEHHSAVKDLDDEDEAKRQLEEGSDSDEDEVESSSEVDESEEQPTYTLRKRPRLCRSAMQEQEEDEDGDDEDEDSDRGSSRSDSEREESGSDEEESDQEQDIVIEEQPKKIKKPTLFNRVIKREEVCSPDFDLSKVKEEEDPEDPENPQIEDVTPKKRPQGRKTIRGRSRKTGDGSDSESPFYEAPPTSLRRATGKRPLITDRSAVEFYDEDEQIRLAIEESLKDQPSTSTSGN